MGCSRAGMAELPDCPNCGKANGGFISSSKWGHWVACCSDLCGFELAKLIEKNKSTRQYRLAVDLRDKLELVVEKLKYSGIRTQAQGRPFD